MRRYLVTGGAGFIGSNIVHALTAQGAEVVVCDRLGEGEKWRNLQGLALAEWLFPEALTGYLAGEPKLSGVIHMGAISSTTANDGDLIIATNVQLSMALWRFCTAAQLPFIYASSAATYGDGGAGFNDTAPLSALQPLNLYGWSKHWFDLWVAHQLRTNQPRPPQWAGLKFFNVYGPNEFHKGGMQSVVAQLYAKVQRGEPVRLFQSHRPDYPDGGQQRDFIYVFDAVAVVEWLLAHPRVSGLFNVGTGTARSFADLAQALLRAMALSRPIEYIPMPEALRPQYQYYTCAVMEKLRQAGYERPFTSLEAGVQEYVQGYLSQPAPYRRSG